MNHGKEESRIQNWFKRHKKPILIGLIVLSVILVIGTIAFNMWVKLPEIPPKPVVDQTPTTSEPVKTPSVSPEIEVSTESTERERREGVYTFLVIGQDTGGGGLTDTMILITYDSIHTTVDAMSLPRDTMVNVPTSSKKLNAVYNYNKGRDPETQVKNGVTALQNEVEGLTSIYPDFYVMISWDAVGELVDALGGVWFDVPFTMDYEDPEQDLYIYQPEGYRLLTGDDAMQVIRHRQNSDGSHSNGDVGRIAVQQDFLMAMAEQCLTPKILLKASSLIEFFLQQVTTNLTFGNLLAFAQSAYNIDVAEDVTIGTMPYDIHYRYTSYVLPIQEELLALLNDGLNPYTVDITADQVELLYKVDDAGRMGVTSGELADPTIAEPPVYREKEEAEEETGEETNPDESIPEDETGEEAGETENPDDTSEEEDTVFPQPEPELPSVDIQENPSTNTNDNEGTDSTQEEIVLAAEPTENMETSTTDSGDTIQE